MWILRIPISVAITILFVSSSGRGNGIFCSAFHLPNTLRRPVHVRPATRKQEGDLGQQDHLGVTNNTATRLEEGGLGQQDDQWVAENTITRLEEGGLELPGSSLGVNEEKRNEEKGTSEEPTVQEFKSVMLHENTVVTQDVPPAIPAMRGRYSPTAKDQTNTFVKVAISAAVGAGVISLTHELSKYGYAELRPLFDLENPLGAVVTVLLTGYFVYSTFARVLPFIDGLRGVDRNKGNPLPKKRPWIEEVFGIKLLSQAPPPAVGLAIAAATTYAVHHEASKLLPGVGATAAGKILLAGLGIFVYGAVCLCLPITVPEKYAYLKEDEPLPEFTLLRYTILPIRPVASVIVNVFFFLRSYLTMTSWPTAWDRVGAFRMDVTSKDTVGQPLGFNSADRRWTSSDHQWSRLQVAMNHFIECLDERLLREPIKQDQVLVPTDEQVWSMCSKTVLSYNVMDNIENDDLLLEDEKCLDMTPMQFYMTIEDYHFTVARVYLQPKTYGEDGVPTRGVVSKFVMSDGAVIRKGDKHWDIAKLHFIATANLFFPAMQHNWVHYHFVDSATAMAKSIMPRGSLLMTIMEPFILGNMYFNEMGLAGLVVSSKPSWIYTVADINESKNEYFVNSIQHRALAFYTGESNYILSDDVLKERIKFGFPPVFMDDDEVPYTVCLRKSYEAFREFAGTVVDIISQDSEAILMFQHWCNEVVRRTSNKILAANVNHVDVLATFMWQVSILHSLDHNAFFYWTEPMNGFSGARCDYKARNAKENMYLADDVRTYREFVKFTGKYTPGDPDDSLEGVLFNYRSNIKEDQCPRRDELIDKYAALKDKLNAYMAEHINEDGHGKHGGVHLDCKLIGSAILN